MTPTPTPTESADAIAGPQADAGLPKLSHAELKALWREYFEVEPPAFRRGFLIRVESSAEVV